MKPLAIIPARGGSKGIPHKNIVPLGGKPLLWHTIEAAKEAGIPTERIILSTDDLDIADSAMSAGLAVPYMRPDNLAEDNTPTRDAVLDVMDWADRRGIEYDCVVLLQPTSPLRNADDIRATMAAYSLQIDMAVTVMPSKANPYYDTYEVGADGNLHISKGPGTFTRRQDAPPCWQMNGAVYVINPDSIRRMPLGEMPQRIPVPMPADRSVDIDTPTDLMLAEALLNKPQQEIHNT